MNPDFDSIAVANPPGVSPTGLRIAVNMLMGMELNESTLGGANGLSFVIPVSSILQHRCCSVAAAFVARCSSGAAHPVAPPGDRMTEKLAA